MRPGTSATLAVIGGGSRAHAGPELPMAGDIEAPLRPRDAALVEAEAGRRLLTAFVRRVKGRRLWVWYRPRGDDEMELVVLTSVPPTE
jgi:hypothetical protein